MDQTNQTNQLNQTALCSQIQEIVRSCGQIILHAERTETMVTAKEGHANFVTTYDKKVQDVLKQKLLALLQEAVFIGEEEDCPTADPMHGYAFIVDPIDGTTNFIKDYKASAISVCLAHDGEPLLGVVYNPYLDELFYAEKGCGAFRNGIPIHVSQTPMERALVLFGTSPYQESLAQKSFAMAYDYFTKAADVRRSGSAALDLCSVAAGRAELFFELQLQPWDFAAGALIVEEAGGIVRTVDGRPYSIGHASSILAASSRIEQELQL